MTAAPLRVAAEESSLGRYRDAWDALAEQAPLPSPFLRSWWLEHTARGRPIFALVLDGETLVGGLAVQERRQWGVLRLELMGSGPLAPDHLDLVAAAGREDEVASAVRDWLRRRADLVIDLHGLTEPSLVAGCLDNVEARVVDETAPYLALPADFPALLATRASRVRNTVKRTAKRLTRDGVTHRTLGAGESAAALDDLERLHGQRWGAGSSFLAEYARFRAAAAAGMDRGELVVHELVAGEEPIAAMAVTHVGGRASFYQSGRSTDQQWRGAGTIVFTDAVEAAVEAGCHEFDLLRGGETYKYDWSTAERDVVRLIGSAGRRRVAARLVAGEVRGRRWLRPHVRRAQDVAQRAVDNVRTKLAERGRPAGDTTDASKDAAAG